MKSTFANARANLSDAQLKHVTGGARVNSRPEAAEDHLIDHVNLDLHGAVALDGHLLAPPKQSMESGPPGWIEHITFAQPLWCPLVRDDDPRTQEVSEIDVAQAGKETIGVVYAEIDGNECLVAELIGRVDISTFIQGAVGLANAVHDKVSITNFDPPQGLVDGNGRSDSGERENTTWPLPSAPDGGH